MELVTFQRNDLSCTAGKTSRPGCPASILRYSGTARLRHHAGILITAFPLCETVARARLTVVCPTWNSSALRQSIHCSAVTTAGCCVFQTIRISSCCFVLYLTRSAIFLHFCARFLCIAFGVKCATDTIHAIENILFFNPSFLIPQCSF